MRPVSMHALTLYFTFKLLNTGEDGIPGKIFLRLFLDLNVYVSYFTVNGSCHNDAQVLWVVCFSLYSLGILIHFSESVHSDSSCK